MVVEVSKIWKGLRKEGMNYGLPTTFVQPGPGAEYESTMDLVKELMTIAGTGWICLVGDYSTQVGMGTVVDGLTRLGFYIEVECSAGFKDPGWFKKADRWTVDYVSEAVYDYGKLRNVDQVRFLVNNERDLAQAKIGFESLKFFPGTKYLKLTVPIKGAEEFVGKYRGSRIYTVEG